MCAHITSLPSRARSPTRSDTLPPAPRQANHPEQIETFPRVPLWPPLAPAGRRRRSRRFPKMTRSFAWDALRVGRASRSLPTDNAPTGYGLQATASGVALGRH